MLQYILDNSPLPIPLLIITLVALIIMVFLCVIRSRSGFWYMQPVFHAYDLHHWIFTNRVIMEDLPEPNKYVTPIDVSTFTASSLTDTVIGDVCDCIREHFLRTELASYNPTDEEVMGFLESSTTPSYVSIYSGASPSKNIVGVITARPLYVHIHDRDIPVNYVDNLCIDSGYRKNGYAPRLIQTLEYDIRRDNPSVKVCLFKREGEMTAIVPITTYTTYGVDIERIPRKTLEYSSAKVVRVSSGSLINLASFVKDMGSKFSCHIHPDKQTFISQLKKRYLDCWMMIDSGVIYAAFFIKNTSIHADGRDCIELVASINACPHEDTFFNAFATSLRRACRSYKAKRILIESTGHNSIILEHLERHNVKHISSCPTAFFLYNYAALSVPAKDCLFIY